MLTLLDSVQENGKNHFLIDLIFIISVCNKVYLKKSGIIFFILYINSI